VLADPAAFRVDPATNPYGDGHASDRIVTALDYVAGGTSIPIRFGPGFSRRSVIHAAGYPGGILGPSLHPRNVQPDRSEEQDRWVGR
jgi:hypothetical protein